MPASCASCCAGRWVARPRSEWVNEKAGQSVRLFLTIFAMKAGIEMMRLLINRVRIALLFAIAGLAACEDAGTGPVNRVCERPYFYYVAPRSRVNVYQSKSEIWIVFCRAWVSQEEAESFFSKYAWIAEKSLASDYRQARLRISTDGTDCALVDRYMKLLNRDEAILSATPIFYLAEEDPDSYLILLSEVLTKHHANRISESAFIQFAESKGLALIEAKNGTQHFKVKEVKTGFESLDMANAIFEAGTADYAQPNFIAKVVRF